MVNYIARGSAWLDKQVSEATGDHGLLENLESSFQMLLYFESPGKEDLLM